MAWKPWYVIYQSPRFSDIPVPPFFTFIDRYQQLGDTFEPGNMRMDTQDFSFDLPANRKQLTEIFRLSNTIGYMGRFDGRAETTLRVSKPGNALFAYVIEGAFEVQYRLMHARDGLVLWDWKRPSWRRYQTTPSLC